MGDSSIRHRRKERRDRKTREEGFSLGVPLFFVRALKIEGKEKCVTSSLYPVTCRKKEGEKRPKRKDVGVREVSVWGGGADGKISPRKEVQHF